MPLDANSTPELQPTPEPQAEVPETLDNVFRQAAGLLETEPEETPAETPPEPTPKPEKKAKPPPEPEPEKELEPPPEPSPEPKKTKRELFRERAQAEKSRRDNDARLKEREAALEQRMARLEELENTYKQFQADPISWLERNNPRAYEEWTARNLASDKTRQPQQDPRIEALEKKIEELKGTIESKSEETGKQVSRAEYVQYMGEAKSIMQNEEFKPIHESAALIADVLGQEVDIEQAIASVWAEYHTQYEQSLTPREVCEILLEDAQAHLERVPKSERLKSLFGAQQEPPKKPAKKSRPQPRAPAQEVEQETSRVDKPVDMYRAAMTKEQLIADAAKLIEYAEEE